jgi:hypothetical protein
VQGARIHSGGPSVSRIRYTFEGLTFYPDRQQQDLLHKNLRGFLQFLDKKPAKLIVSYYVSDLTMKQDSEPNKSEYESVFNCISLNQKSFF